MTGLLTPNPNFSWGGFAGNALSGIGAGLLSYGAGGQLRQQAPLIAIQGMQQAQQAQAEQAQRALQTQSLTQQLAMQQMQMQRAQQADQQAAQQKQQYLGLLGGQPIQGPTPSGAPLDIKSPVNPALANLSPAMQSMLPLMDPSQGMGMIAQLTTRKPDAPIVRDFQVGNQIVSKQYNEKTKGWDPLTTGNKWDPSSGQGNPQKLSLNPIYYTDPTTKQLQVGQLGMDGKLHPVDLPQGATWSPGTTSVDTATGTTIINSKNAQPITTVSKDVAGAATDKALGTAKGQAKFNLPTAINSIDSTIQHVNELKADKNLPDALGFIGSQWSKVPNTAAYGVRQKIAQIAGESFLSARQQLKGGGQITDYEGGKAEQALARLNAAQNKDDFIKALDDFQTHLENAKQVLVQQAGAAPSTTSAPAADPFGIR